jgi:diphosphomevalonate decarboxylase
MSFSVKVITSPNIALIKYWGKIDEENIIPLNESISITLNQRDFNTETVVRKREGDVDKDLFILNDKLIILLSFLNFILF